MSAMMDGQVRIVVSGEESVATNVCSVQDPPLSIASIVPKTLTALMESAHVNLDG